MAECSDLLGRGPKYVNGARDGFDAAVYVRPPVQTSRRAVAKMRAQRKLLRGLEVDPYSEAAIPLPSDMDKNFTPRLSTPTGTTPLGPDAGVWRSMDRRPNASARTCGPRGLAASNWRATAVGEIVERVG